MIVELYESHTTTLEVGNDADSDYQDYYYIKALNIEVMNEKGQDTVNN